MIKKLLGYLSYISPPPLNKYISKARGVNFQCTKSTWIGMGTLIDNLFPEKIFVGQNVTISFCVKIIAHIEPPQSMQARFLPMKSAPVVIGNNVFIGAGAIILPGVTVNDWSLIAAGSVVNRDVPSFAIVAGVPARIVGDLRETEEAVDL